MTDVRKVEPFLAVHAHQLAIDADRRAARRQAQHGLLPLGTAIANDPRHNVGRHGRAKSSFDSKTYVGRFVPPARRGLIGTEETDGVADSGKLRLAVQCSAR